jgi:hypothetical protein
MKRARLWMLILTFAALSACRAPASEPDARARPVNQDIAARRDSAQALVANAEQWIVRLSSAPPADRERAEALSADLRARLAAVKPALERESPALWHDGAFQDQLDDLENAYDRAIANIPAERRAAEQAMTDASVALGDEMDGFRVTLSSAGIQSNLEMKRRTAQLELARREIAETLTEMKRGSADTWPVLKRRWDQEVKDFHDDLTAANQRTSSIRPDPTPTPTPLVKRIPKPASH